MNKKRISLCTICMNRLTLIRETLPANIQECLRHGNAEILLLDYNSRDGLESWVRNNLQKYIDLEVLTFYKIIDPVPEFFSHPHSRNIVFRLASGDILCNVNSDYFIENGFLDFIADKIDLGKSIAYISNFNHNPKDNFGRLCLRKNDFLKVGGFDESYQGYGYEDTDICMRLGMAGVELKYLPDKYCSKFIRHDDKKRTENMYDFHNMQKILWRKISKNRREVLFLFKDHRVEKGTLKKSSHDIPDLCEGRWITGTWEQTFEDSVKIYLETGQTDTLQRVDKANSYCQGDSTTRFHEIADQSSRERVILKKSQIRNYQLLKNRRLSGNYCVNQGGFGKATVIKNFSTRIDIQPRPESDVSFN